jgi:hypothetical protein
MQLSALTPRRLAGVAVLACAAALTPAAALAAAASPSAPAAAASAAAVASTPACATSGLVIWMQPGGVAAGSAFFTLMFTNLSGHACTLDGHPGVAAASLAGHRIGTPAAWNPPGPRLVRLASGGTAYAVLQYSDVITGGGGPRPCHAVTAAGLQVYPPGQTTAKVVPIPLTACTTRGLVYMTVRPVQKTQPPGLTP